MTQSPSAVSSSRADRVRRRGNRAGPQPYDFQRPIKLSREHMRTLQISYENFARSWGTLFTTRLRVVSQANLLAIEQLSFDEYLSSLSTPTMIIAVTIEPLSGTALLELSVDTALACIDHLLGGPGGPQPQRQLTELEMPLLRSLLDRVMSELATAFAGLTEFQPRLGAVEYNPQFVRAQAAPTDAAIVASFELKVGGEECIATFCLPFNSIRPALNKDADIQLTAAERAEREAARRGLARGLVDAPVEVAVRFQPIRMRTGDIVGLRPGDVVPLGHPVSQPLAIMLNDAVFAHAVPGNRGARLACLVVPAPTKEPNR